MVFVLVNTRFDWSRKFNIVFGVDRTYTIGHIVVLFGFSDKPYLVWSSLVLFSKYIAMYEQSRHCPV